MKHGIHELTTVKQGGPLTTETTSKGSSLSEGYSAFRLGCTGHKAMKGKCFSIILAAATFACGIGHAQSPSGVVGWGYVYADQAAVLNGLSDITAVSVGASNGLALKVDGTVVEWGSGGGFDHTQVPVGLSSVTEIAAGGEHSLALKSDGTVVVWGDNRHGQQVTPAGLSGVVAIAAGGFHSLALKADGTVVAWGDNDFGQTTVPETLSGVVAIAAGGFHSLALKSDGTVVAWGKNAYGQTTVPAGLSGVVAVAAGGDHNLALKSDGTLVAWGGNWSGQTNVPDGQSGVVAISAGGDHNLALKSDGTVVAWGDNQFGESTLPAGLSGVAAVAAGYFSSYALVNIVEPTFSFRGFLSPIGGADSTGGSFAQPVATFKMGGATSVKFIASLPDGSPVTSGVHTLTVTKYTSPTAHGTPLDAVSENLSAGDQFTLQPNGQWLFKLDTLRTGMSTGIWNFVATLSDRTQHNAWIRLK